MSDLVKSPQERALENLIWDRLSAFWTQVYDVSDKDALNAMYDAFLKALDAEFVRLFQIDDSKSLFTAPVYTQRRWVRLDLNRYDTLKKWFRFLTGGDPFITTGGQFDGGDGGDGGSGGSGGGDDGTGIPGGSNASTCSSVPTNHTKHWHINFPWRMPVDATKTLAERQTIQLSLPIFQSLSAVWRMVDGRGTRLSAGIDYIVGSGGKSIRILQAQPSHVYEIEAAFDFSAPVFDGLAPVVLSPLGFTLPRTLVLPGGFGAKLPFHALVVRNPPPLSIGVTDGTVVCSATNTPLYTTQRTFVPYTASTVDGVSYTSTTRALLPASVSLDANDVVLLFGMQETDRVPTHRHVRATRVIGGGTPVSTLELYEYSAAPPAFGVVGLFGHEFRITVNGELLAPSEYQFDANTGTLNFKSAQQPDAAGFVRVDIEYTNEAIGDEDSLDTAGHLHYTCSLTVVNVPETFDTFDDGETFDDVGTGTFDTSTASNVVTFDVAADLTSLNVYVNGVLLNSGPDYTASVIGSGSSARLRLYFTSPIKGKTVQLTFRAPSMPVQIGGSDLARGGGAGGVGGTGSTLGTDMSVVSNRYGITQTVLDNLAANFVQLTTAFKLAYQVSDADMQRLIEAAYIAAAGGNPVLTLFFDEFPEYAGMPVDAQGLILNAANTRAVESAGTDFVDIPYLQDHVLSPTIRLFAGTDYVVSRGQISGSAVLLRKRGPDDAMPGQWWVPLLVLDEQFLSRNFGTLLGDLRLSTVDYRDALAANLRLRYQGATRANLHRAACIYLGSSAFQNDAIVSGYEQQTEGFTVTISSSTGNAQETVDMRQDDRLPEVGDNVYPGQSLRGSTIYDKKLTGLIGHERDAIFVTDAMHDLRPGDTFRAQMTDPVYGRVSWLTRTVLSVEPVTNTVNQYNIVRFTRQTDYLPFNGMLIRASRDNGAPYASIEGFVTAITPTMRKYLVLDDEVGTRIEVPADAPEQFTAGQQVYRGDPVDPSLALVYDGVSRPEWYKSRASDFRAMLQGKVAFDSGRIASGSIRIQPRDAGDLALVTITPTPPTLARGTLLVVTLDSDRSTHTFEVSGPGTLPGQYYAMTDDVGSVEVAGSVDIQKRPTAGAEYLELSPGASVVSVSLTTRAMIGTSALSVTDTSSLPAVGRCRLLLPSGTALDIQYEGKDRYELRNVRWGNTGRVEDLADQVYGVLPVEAPVGCVVTLTGRLADTLINPAFSALVAVRTKVPNSTSGVVVTAENAPTLYAMLQNTATIIETSAMARPEPLLAAISDVTPVGSTTLIYAKQVFADALDVNPDDRQAMFQTPTVQIVPADPDVVPVEAGTVPVIWLPPNLMSIGLNSDLDLGAAPAPASLQGDFSYQWTVSEEVSTNHPAKTSRLDGATLRIDLNDPNSVLFVKLIVTHRVTNATATATVRVRRFNTPAIAIQVTAPSGATALVGGEWSVPSPNPTVTLAATVAAAPSVVGPYTYSWSVINEAAPFVAPTVTGGATSTPTFNGVAANAVLKATLVVTASGVDPSLTRTFEAVTRVRLV